MTDAEGTLTAFAWGTLTRPGCPSPPLVAGRSREEFFYAQTRKKRPARERFFVFQCPPAVVPEPGGTGGWHGGRRGGGAGCSALLTFLVGPTPAVTVGHSCCVVDANAHRRREADPKLLAAVGQPLALAKAGAAGVDFHRGRRHVGVHSKCRSRASGWYTKCALKWTSRRRGVLWEEARPPARRAWKSAGLFQAVPIFHVLRVRYLGPLGGIQNTGSLGEEQKK